MFHCIAQSKKGILCKSIITRADMNEFARIYSPVEHVTIFEMEEVEFIPGKPHLVCLGKIYESHPPNDQS